MTSTIKVNTIQNTCGADIIKESSNTITIGASGDTVALASGASQTGFGRNGAVDWQTTVKTSNFTAAAGEGYFVDTNGGAISVNLPAGTAGAIVGFKDYRNNFNTAALTLVQNGSDKIGGSTVNSIIDVEGISITLVFIDSTRGWLVTDSGLQSESPTAQFVAATGGSIATCGDYKVHTFTSPGTFCVSNGGNSAGSNSVEYVVVAGGGGAGGSQGGGGGAGGFRFASPSLAPVTYPAKPLAAPANVPVTATAFPITVGGGGAGASHPGTANGTSGSNSIFSSITSAGGGGGATGGSPTSGPSATYPSGGHPGYAEGLPGGSGGGTRGTYLSPGSTGPNNHYNNPGGVNLLANGNVPPVSPPQGNRGGGGYDGINQDTSAGGGGGATAVGNDARGPGGQGTSNGAGPGGAGAGLPTAFGSNGQPCGSFRYYAGGGGGGTNVCAPTPGGTGGLGGGGAGNGNPGGSSPGTAGTTNTGGGGGAGAGNSGGAGGSGIVIIRYKFQ